MRDSGRRSGKSDGFILIAVLAVLALLSSMFLVLSLLSRSAVGGAGLARSDLAADALMQAGTELAGYQLFVLKTPAADLDGQRIRLNGGVITLSVAPESGKVDLNRGGRGLLAAAYRASSLTIMTPDAFADRVIDWRDADDEVGDEGAEGEAYEAAGLPYGPANRPFRDVDEIRWLPGLRAVDITALRPFLTVYNPGGRVDFTAAPADLLRALPDVAPERLEEALTLRAAQGDIALAELEGMLAEYSGTFSFDPPAAYRVRIEARPNGADRVKMALATMFASASPAKAYQIAEWRPVAE